MQVVELPVCSEHNPSGWTLLACGGMGSFSISAPRRLSKTIRGLAPLFIYLGFYNTGNSLLFVFAILGHQPLVYFVNHSLPVAGWVMLCFVIPLNSVDL